MSRKFSEKIAPKMIETMPLEMLPNLLDQAEQQTHFTFEEK